MTSPKGINSLKKFGLTAIVFGLCALVAAPAVHAYATALAAQTTPTAKTSSAPATAVLDESKQQLIKMYADRTIERFDAVLKRLTNIAGRIGTRLDKMQASGTSVGAARGDLETSRADIADAQASTDAIQASIDTLLASTKPAKDLAHVRDAVAAAGTKINTARDELVTTLDAARAALTGNPSTTTAATTTETH